MLVSESSERICRADRMEKSSKVKMITSYLYTKLKWSHLSQKNWKGPVLWFLALTDPKERDLSRDSKLLATATLCV